MKIIQSNAISLNGMIARSNGDEDWLPSAGWDEFVQDALRFQNFIMGRETYELVMKLYPSYNFNDVAVPYKLIVTSRTNFKQPEGYIVVDSPENAIKFLEAQNIAAGLLVGGGKLNSSFYARKLVDEVCLTINPKILGTGRSFIANFDGIEVDLELMDVAKLDKQRVQLRYKVI